MKESGELIERPAKISRETLLLPVGEKGVEVSAEYFYRSCPHEKIIARGASLFSIVKGFPNLKLKRKEASVPSRKSPAGVDKDWPKSTEGTFLVIYYGELNLENRPSEKELIPGTQKSPVPKKEWPELLDGLMRYPEDEQFRRLEQEYLQTCDPGDPTLTEFIQEFINLNLNGAFFIDEAFLAAFDSLEELFYKKPVFECLLFHIRKAPDSLLAAEFLFCLASSLNFEKRVIAYLSRAYLQAKDLQKNEQGLVYTFNSRAKALAIKTVYEELLKLFAARGFRSIDEVLDRYDKEELKIYQYLAEKDGRVRDRALLAMGLHFWNQGNEDEAAKLWLKISPAYNTPPFPMIRDSLYDRRSMFSRTNIDHLLTRESLRITHILNQRAVKFHKWSRRTAG